MTRNDRHIFPKKKNTHKKLPPMRLLSIAIIAAFSGAAQATIINASTNAQTIDGDTDYVFLEGETTSKLLIKGNNNSTFSNYGNIKYLGSESSAIQVSAPNINIINNTSGNIYGGSYSISDIDGSSAVQMSITNSGDISIAGNTSRFILGAVAFGSGSSGAIDNYGTLNGGRIGNVGSNAIGVSVNTGNAVSINNHTQASIASGSAESAIKIIGNSTKISVTNDGTITGAQHGIYQTNGAVKIQNNSTGSITSVSQAAVEINGGSTLENHGIISSNQAAAIQLDGSKNAITLGTGSVLKSSGNNAIFSKGTGNTLTLTSNDATTSVENGDMTGDTAEHSLSQLTSSAGSQWVLGGNIALAGTTADTLNALGSLTLTNSITLSGAGGGTTIAGGGTLTLGNGTGSNGTVEGTIVDNGSLVFNHSNDMTSADVISGSGSLTQSGTGTLTLTGNNTFTGTTTIDSGSTLQLGDGGKTGSVAGNVVDNGTLVFNHSEPSTFGNIISGSGSLTQSGGGSLILTGDNTYTGSTTISANSLLLLGNGGTTGSVAGSIVNDGELEFIHSNAMTYGNIISGSGWMSLDGTGPLTLTGDNTFTGVTEIASDSTLSLGDGGTSGSVAGDIINKGTLNINHTDHETIAGELSGKGALNQIGTGTTTLTAQNSTQGAVSVISGMLDLAQTGNFVTNTLDVASAATLKLEEKARLLVNGTAKIQGEVDVNIVNGGPVITANSVTLGADSTLNVVGLSAGVTDKASQIPQTRTTVLQTTQGITGDFAHVNFTSLDHPDYLLVDGLKSADNLSYSLGEELAWTSTTRDANGNFTLAGADDHFNVDVVLADQNTNATTGWDGKSLIKAGDGNLTLSSVNTYTGTTSVQGGTLTTDVAHALDSTSNVDIAGNANLNLNNFDQTLKGLTGTGNVSLGSAKLGISNATTDPFGGTISGNGSLDKNGAGTLILTGNNTFTGDTTVSAGTLQIGNGNTGGSLAGNIIDNATVAFNLNSNSVLNSVISGSGQLVQQGAGILTLTGENTYTGGTTVSTGTVRLEQDGAASTGTVNINTAGTLDVAFNDAAFRNDVTGAGQVKVSGQGVALGGDATGFTGVWDVTGGASAAQQSNLGNAQILLDGTQSLLTLDNFDETFTSQLTGNGMLQVNQNSTTTPFSFAASTGTAFTGTVKIQQGTLALDTNAEQTLANSTLALTPDGIATMDSDRSIHNLILGGGTLQMDNSRTVAHTLTTETFDASAGGRIQANIPEELSPPVIPTNPSYFDQDVVRNVQVVKATGDVTGVGNHLDLFNFDGSALTGNSLDVGITEGDVSLGTATYGQAAVVTEDGAWVGFDLVKLDASAGQILTLENQPGMDNMLVAQLTGAGNFDIQASGTVILNNLANDYTGDTLISSGNVQLASDNALGHTNEVSIASGTGLDVNGKTQAITTLHAAAGSNLDLNGGNLTIAQGGESLGMLAGSGQLNLDGGELTINGANQHFSASTQIAQSAIATLNDSQGLGSGAINVDGTLNLSGANGTMSNLLSGNGSVALEEGAQVTLNNTVRAFAGDFNVATGTQLTAQEAGSLGTATVTNNGTLELNNNADWTLTNAVSGNGGVNKTGTGTLFADQNMTYTGDTHITAGALQVNGDFASTGTMYVEQAGALKGSGSVAGSVVNSGVIDLTSATQNNALTINGDYSSNNGQLWVSSELNGDSSAHDELFVKGNTLGNTDVTIKDMHGLGTQTVNGIELVNVQGQSDGTFALQGRAVAGAYEYKLYKGTPSGENGNWYLRSASTTPVPDPTPDDGSDVNPDPDSDSDLPPDSGSTPEPVPASDTPVLRPEAGAYLANQSLANSVFMSTMHDRNGENRQTGEDSPAAWAHLDAGRVNSKAGGGQLSMGSNTTVLRIGSDVYRHDFGNQQIKAGLMTGYAHADTGSDSKHVSDSAKSTLEGYNFGVYGTWFGGSADQKSGPYADTWMQYGTFHNTVKGDDLAEEKYHAHNWAGSLELGYRMPVSSTHALYLQPQFQTIYSNYSQGDHTEDNGTRIHSQDSGGVTTRLGARLSGQLDKAGTTEPFVELNWWHGGSSNSVQMDTETVNQSIPVNRYEAKVGAQLKTGKNWTLWINSGVQAGENDYSSVQGQIGGKYSW